LHAGKHHQTELPMSIIPACAGMTDSAMRPHSRTISAAPTSTNTPISGHMLSHMNVHAQLIGTTWTFASIIEVFIATIAGGRGASRQWNRWRFIAEEAFAFQTCAGQTATLIGNDLNSAPRSASSVRLLFLRDLFLVVIIRLAAQPVDRVHDKTDQ
jgi:hypothetical protein